MRKALAIALILFVFGIFLFFFGIKNFGKVVEESFVEINLNKNKFFQYETIQIEIKGIFSRPIFEDDVKIKKNDLMMPVKFYVDKVSNDYYIAYATLNLPKGKYDVEIKVYTERGIEIFKKEIEIEETDNKYYISLYNEIKEKINVLKDRELIYVAKAIEEIDEERYNYALEEIKRRINGLDDLEKAILLLVLKTEREDFYILRNKLINYFLAMQDNDLGDYVLNIKGNTKCSINNVTYDVLGERNISISINSLILNDSFNFSFSCENATQAFLIKDYFGNKKIYDFEKINNTFYLNKTLGSLKEDKELTSIMLVVFYQYNISQYRLAYDWIKKNEGEVLEKIVLAHLNDTQAINDLINYQNYDGSFDGYKNFSKAEITCLASKVIVTRSLAEEWIRKNINAMNVKDKASCLVFALEKKDVVGFMPGVIKGYTGESFDLYLKNYGIKKVNVSLTNLILNLSYKTQIEKDQMKKLRISIPFISYEKNYLIDSILLEYDQNQNYIPVLIFIKSTNLTKPEINETIEKNLTINQTEKSLNESVNFTIKILSIIPEKIDLNVTNQTSVKVVVKNVYRESINLNVAKSASLEEIATITPSQLSLLPNQQQEISIFIDTKNARMKSYQGVIEIEARYNNVKQYYEIPIRIDIVSIETCSGQICKIDEVCEGNYVYTQQGICCLGKCKKIKKEGNKAVGVVLIILGFIFLVAAIFFILKRPKKEKKIGEVIKKIQRQEEMKEKEVGLKFKK
jgi:hypothetical protein